MNLDDIIYLKKALGLSCAIGDFDPERLNRISRELIKSYRIFEGKM